MTGDVLNLRQFRKRQARADKEKQAEENRIRFGRTKAEKTLTRSLNDQAERRLDQGRRDPLPEAPVAPPAAPGSAPTTDGET